MKWQIFPAPKSNCWFLADFYTLYSTFTLKTKLGRGTFTLSSTLLWRMAISSWSKPSSAIDRHVNDLIFLITSQTNSKGGAATSSSSLDVILNFNRRRSVHRLKTRRASSMKGEVLQVKSSSNIFAAGCSKTVAQTWPIGIIWKSTSRRFSCVQLRRIY